MKKRKKGKKSLFAALCMSCQKECKQPSYCTVLKCDKYIAIEKKASAVDDLRTEDSIDALLK